MNLATIEAWASAHPYLASVVVLTVAPAVTSAVAEAIRRAGKADTWWGGIVLALCADVMGAVSAAKGGGLKVTPAPGPLPANEVKP